MAGSAVVQEEVGKEVAEGWEAGESEEAGREGVAWKEGGVKEEVLEV